MLFGGAVHKYRHWPPLVGAGAFGVFEIIEAFNLNLVGIEKFIQQSDYHGPFSVEFVHTRSGENYFMEVNFRNEGLAYASTCAGANRSSAVRRALRMVCLHLRRREPPRAL